MKPRRARAALTGSDHRRAPATRPPTRLTVRWLHGQLRELVGSLDGRRLCVAFSGGLDSTVLLDALASLRKSAGFELRALHIHHHLHAAADDWAASAAAQARRLRVAFELLHTQVRAGPGASVEAAAREARYAALGAALRPDEVLLTAHHLEDQFETLLLALLRGSGVPGLAAMPGKRVSGTHLLLRPLLPVSRLQLQSYARRRQLAWRDDDSNLDERFDRNYLRHSVLPQLYSRWPAAAITASRTAAHLAEAQGLLDVLADSMLAGAVDGRALRVSVLRRIDPPSRRNLLRRWLRTLGLPPPDHRRMRELAETMLEARVDALPCVSWGTVEVRRYGDRLQATDRPAPHSGVDLSWNWRRHRWLSLPDGGAIGLLPDPHGNVALGALPPILQVAFRRGGERLRASHGHPALKNLLQAQRVPPWQRASVPLLFDGDNVVAVADLWLDGRYEARTPRRRARLRWRPAAGSPRGEVSGQSPGE